ncbi:Cyclin-L1 [Triplophysa tibetana]|uniref:Cyclin-L1 n=1 Tax=Triplophysa tibetana TaxID=1572043 RepID=A0A5A9P1W6_9TELE|nr:Cyclin-L1 [Triplophysa tibetana]
MTAIMEASMATGPAINAPANSEGILIGDKVYSEVILTIDNSLIPDEKLSSTLSMQDGLDLETETYLRILGCELIQSAGILLRLPQVAMATGQVLFHRFFYSKSFVKHSFEVRHQLTPHVSNADGSHVVWVTGSAIVAMSCVNLASKIEEAPRRIRDVINVFHHLRQLRGKKTPSPLILDQNYISTKNQVIKAERRILKELGFCVHVKHPHKIIVMYLQVLECEKNQTLVQTAWDYMNDSLRTNVFVRFQAETIACACIFLAARVLQIPLPTRPHWYLLFGATEEEIKDICTTTLKLYTRKKVRTPFEGQYKKGQKRVLKTVMVSDGDEMGPFDQTHWRLVEALPNYELLEKEVDKRKVVLQEAKLKAKGLNPDGTPALTLGGFSPGSKPCSPNVTKADEKSPNPQTLKAVKKEPEDRPQGSKSPHNGLRKDNKLGRNSRSATRSRSRSRSRSPRRHYNNRRSHSGTYSSRSRSRSHSRSASPRRNANHGPPSPLLQHLKSKQRSDDLHSQSRHGHKRKRSRSRSRSVSKPRDRDRERERDRERDRGSSDLAKKHKHERSGYHRDRRDRSRSYERSHKSKHHSSSHTSHSRHRR